LSADPGDLKNERRHSMRRKLIGVVAGLAVWMGSTLVAEAQGITPTGPLTVKVTDTSVVYTATITTNYSFTVYLYVYKNGTSVYGGQWYIVNSGPSYNFQSPVLSTSSWGLAIGDLVNFHLIVQLAPTHRTTNDYNLTVQPGGTSMGPRLDSDSMMASALPNRKREIDELFGLGDGIVA
jgi:hypothetical protein